MAFVVICEAAADFRTATDLAIRVIRENAAWIDEEQVSHLFQWSGRDATTPFWLWREIGAIAKEAGIRTRGRFNGESGRPDAQTARRALNYLRGLILDGQPIDGILLIRDDDGDPAHRRGLEQGRESVPDLTGRIVIGLAHYKRECWVLAGFLPADLREESILQDERRKLTFHPCLESHRLRARDDGEDRIAKRVLAVLTQDKYECEEVCWVDTALQTLRERGGGSGLTSYLAEVEERLVPLFTGRPFEREQAAG